MKTKKKVLVIALAISLIAVAVGGTLAWFTDQDETTNVFTYGSVDIEQEEVFDQSTAELLPVVGTDPTVATDNYIQKEVTVKNIGKNDAYVQTFVAVPAILDNNGIVKLYDANLTTNGWEKVDGDATVVGVQPVVTDVTITGETLKYNLYLYRYATALAAPTGQSTETVTAPCLEYVYIDKTIDLDVVEENGVKKAYFVLADGTTITGYDATQQLNVYVATQAVQEKGFADAEAAFDSAFADDNGDYLHPWL